MPRKSASSLTIVPLVPGQGRPEPPGELDALEQRLWREVVDALPGHWLDPAGQVVLRRAVAQAAICERQEARLRGLRAQDQDHGEEALALAVTHGVIAKVVAHLLGQLRATPRARLSSREAGPRVTNAPRPARPWDIRA
jgi:hypothetical protein